MEASVRTLSALLTQGDPNALSSPMQPAAPSLEDRVAATLGAQLAAALAQAVPSEQPELQYDDPSPDEEDELEDEQYSSGPDHGPPLYRSRDGSREQSPVDDDRPSVLQEKTLSGPGGEVQVMIVEGLDGEEFPITLRARKGKDSDAVGVVSGVKRKR